MADYKFINPYNFVPLGKECLKTKYEDGQYTGYIECELETKTPLIMIDSSKCEEEYCDGDRQKANMKHEIYDKTFTIKGIPAIPGSELRGMIRSKFETLTNSCLSNTDYNLKFGGRYIGTMRKAGLLINEDGNWKLYKCVKYWTNDFNIARELNSKCTGDLIQFEKNITDDNIKNKNKIVRVFDGSMEGYLRKGEEFGRKITNHIFVKTDKVVDTKDIDLEKMYTIVSKRFENNLKRKHRAYTSKDVRPVWYEFVGEKLYLSLSENGQVEYYRQFKDLIPYSFKACDSKDEICETCSVFGTINKELALASRVRVEDAVLQNHLNDYYATEKNYTLAPLGKPNYENAKFYLLYVKDGKKLLSPDFTATQSYNKELVDIKDGEICIRGRKEYWHHKPDLTKRFETSNQNKSVRPLKEGLIYTFKVYFDNLTETQLEHLILSISLGKNSDYMHKLGMGKPLGFGSVKVKTKNIVCKQVSYENHKFSYHTEEYIPKYTSIKETFNLNNKQLRAIQHLYSYNFLIDKMEGVVVDYPRLQENGNIFDWFSKNKEKRLPFADEEYEKLVLGERRKYQNAFKNNNRFKR